MIAQATFFGGARDHTDATAEVVLKRGTPRFRHVSQGTPADAFFTLPDATTLRRGGPHFAIANTDATEAVEVNDFEGNLVVSIAAGAAAVFYLHDNTTPAGDWRYRSRTVVT